MTQWIPHTQPHRFHAGTVSRLGVSQREAPGVPDAPLPQALTHPFWRSNAPGKQRIGPGGGVVESTRHFPIKWDMDDRAELPPD